MSNELRVCCSPCKQRSWCCLQACLMLVEKRETRYRVQWYYRLFEETRYGLQPNQALEVCHGSLLALGELLCHTGARPAKRWLLGSA